MRRDLFHDTCSIKLIFIIIFHTKSIEKRVTICVTINVNYKRVTIWQVWISLFVCLILLGPVLYIFVAAERTIKPAGDQVSNPLDRLANEKSIDKTRLCSNKWNVLGVVKTLSLYYFILLRTLWGQTLENLDRRPVFSKLLMSWIIFGLVVSCEYYCQIILIMLYAIEKKKCLFFFNTSRYILMRPMSGISHQLRNKCATNQIFPTIFFIS